ncbi:hypothetical protein C7974DRAFT_405537 [Boeremia exigua]|uniref:uncharacterized protein n=1 Tax=Boeremia exigua TaxID=749465 RepID=UPI001E8CC4FE|nr:uncharacterized protein C7974DRAFT_405537 [Boeremia exigua]KAH6612429.1 hypothetical protein C7974DRAFT_405537 [Boeremia exigua]
MIWMLSLCGRVASAAALLLLLRCCCCCVCAFVTTFYTHDCLLSGSSPDGQRATFLLVGEENRFLAGPCLLHPTHCRLFRCVGLFI